MMDWARIWEDHGLPLAAMAWPKPKDAWAEVREGPAEMPSEFEGHEKMWVKIAERLGFKPTQKVQQRAPIIGGRRRYHHRPLTSWKLPGNKGTLTITTDEMEAKSWNRLKGKRNPYTPRIKDVFELRLTGGDRYWAIHHENLAYPPPQDWYLFIDTFFRWRATTKGGLQMAKPSDLKQFLEWLLLPDPEAQIRKKQEAILPFKIKEKRDKKVDKVREQVWKDPGLPDKIKWAKSALRFLKANNIKHRDLDPSNLAKTAKGKPVITNIAESRSRGKNIGRIGRVKGGVSARTKGVPNPLDTMQAIQALVDPRAPVLASGRFSVSGAASTYGLIHLNPQMRAAVLGAVHGNQDAEQVAAGLQQLKAFALRDSKARELYEAMTGDDMSQHKTFEPAVLSATATAPEIVEAISVLLDEKHKVGAAAPCNASRFVLARFIYRNPDVRLAMLTAANDLPLWTLADQELNALSIMKGMKTFAAHIDQLGPEAEKLFMKAAKVLARMSVEEALKVLEVDRKAAGDPASLKKAHRAVALKKHPDRGGSKEEMQRVNEAYDLLKRSRIDPLSPEDHRARHAREKEEAIKQMNEIGDQVDKMLQPDKFTKHFEKHAGKKFTVEVDKKTAYGDRYGGHELVWTSEDGETIFVMSIALADWNKARQLGGGDDDILAFDLRINQEIIHARKKSKFKERTWKSTNKAKDVLDPAKEFPPAKIKKMMAGKEKARKFSKRDMKLGIERYLKGDVSQEWASFQLGDAEVQMWRMVMLRMAMWELHSIKIGKERYKAHKMGLRSAQSSAYESDELLRNLIDLQKMYRGKSVDPKKAMEDLGRAFTQAKEEFIAKAEAKAA